MNDDNDKICNINTNQDYSFVNLNNTFSDSNKVV